MYKYNIQYGTHLLQAKQPYIVHSLVVLALQQITELLVVDLAIIVLVSLLD